MEGLFLMGPNPFFLMFICKIFKEMQGNMNCLVSRILLTKIIVFSSKTEQGAFDFFVLLSNIPQYLSEESKQQFGRQL